jgi:glycosyltransferase involved in cell wall biosynthesis
MINVLQIIDSLNAGGAESVAVNYANGLLGIVDNSHICTTRDEGLLQQSINPSVGYVYLNKKSALDINAIIKFKNYVAQNKINIIHAHSSSFFIATVLKIIYPKIKIIWHDHYGNSEFLSKRPKTVLKHCSKHFSHIFSVNKELESWSKQNLKCENVSYVKNFPTLNNKSNITNLNGNDGKRILCLANLREQKNHPMLLKAFSVVKDEHPDWSLHCVGKDFNDSYSQTFFNEIEALNLKNHIYFYSSKSDILNIMNQCEIGVLVSKSEGLPLALLEYGIAKLAVIATNVGDCGMLIRDESYGMLVESNDTSTLINSLKRFIIDRDYRLSCATKYNIKISEDYSGRKILKYVSEVYQKL